MAKKSKKVKGKDKKKKGAKAMPLLLVGLALAFFLQATFIFFLLGIIPGIVAYYADPSKNKIRFRIIFTCNFSGVAPYVATLLMNRNEMSLFWELALDPVTWLIMYMSAGVGWILLWGTPYVVEFIYEFTNSAKIARLQSTQDKLVEEWGPEIQRSV